MWQKLKARFRAWLDKEIAMPKRPLREAAKAKEAKAAQAAEDQKNAPFQARRSNWDAFAQEWERQHRTNQNPQGVLAQEIAKLIPKK